MRKGLCLFVKATASSKILPVIAFGLLPLWKNFFPLRDSTKSAALASKPDEDHEVNSVLEQIL